VSDCRVQVWSVTTGRRIWESEYIAEGITAVAISPDGSRIATGDGWAKARPLVRVFRLPALRRADGTASP